MTAHSGLNPVAPELYSSGRKSSITSEKNGVRGRNGAASLLVGSSTDFGYPDPRKIITDGNPILKHRVNALHKLFHLNPHGCSLNVLWQPFHGVSKTMLYPLNLYSAAGQLYLYKTGRKYKKSS